MTTRLAHTGDPVSSHIAAERLDPDVLSEVKEAILQILAAEPMPAFRLTEKYFELREARGWPDVKPDCIAKRLSDLKNARRVCQTGGFETTPFNRPAAVWEPIRGVTK